MVENPPPSPEASHNLNPGLLFRSALSTLADWVVNSAFMASARVKTYPNQAAQITRDFVYQSNSNQ